METTIDNYKISVRQADEKGMPWIVSLRKGGLLFGKRISSDWFLEKEQAEGFARQLAEILKTHSAEEKIRDRKPGWQIIPSAR